MRNERNTEDAPELLKRARDWFISFTHKRYVLEISSDGLFQALDTHTQQRHSLSELSDGTRVQLLLAARIAFIEHTERGGPPMPLFLDEALSTTDPKRFKEIARAVLTLAQTRQIFSLQGQPVCRRWPHLYSNPVSSNLFPTFVRKYGGYEHQS